MNMNKWFVRADDLHKIDDFVLLTINSERMNEIETDQMNSFWKYRPIVELAEVLRFSFDTLIVLSTDDELMGAARYAWMLFWLGYNRIRILIGSIDPSWKIASSRTSFRLPIETPLRPAVRMTCDELFEAFLSSKTTFVDVRTYEEYSGQITGYNYIRHPGRIPFFQHDPLNGIYADIRGTISWNDLNNYLDLMKTTSFYRNLSSKRIVFMCGTGWRASLSAIFADILELADLITVLDSGWYEWSERYKFCQFKPVKNDIFGLDFDP